jgi:NNP family nitrate/nitrite transporter-like MFS transporter
MGAVLVMIIFSVFVQAAEGSTYGIVPYVDPPATGSVSGIVGAGGNVGAVGFGMGFRELNDRDAFFIMGCTIMASAVTTVLININGHRGILFGKDAERRKG